MKLNAQLLNTDHGIIIEPVDDGVIANVDGRSYELEVRELSSGEYLILHGTTVFRCRVDPMRHQRNSFEVSLRGHSYDITVFDPKRLRSGHASGVHDHGAAEIVSPMPGKVVRLLVEVGNPVEVGNGIVVVEAMKMQNELKSPKAGVVVSINAEAGATVNAGDVLAVIE
ncbi:MAG: biotin/lipoyl-containing protein [Acidobacteriota bacterium]